MSTIDIYSGLCNNSYSKKISKEVGCLNEKMYRINTHNAANDVYILFLRH